MGLKKAKADTPDPVGTHMAPVTTAVGTTNGYQVSVWTGSQPGCGIKLYVEPEDGETLTEAARRANKLGVTMLRDLETQLDK